MTFDLEIAIITSQYVLLKFHSWFKYYTSQSPMALCDSPIDFTHACSPLPPSGSNPALELNFSLIFSPFHFFLSFFLSSFPFFATPFFSSHGYSATS